MLLTLHRFNNVAQLDRNTKHALGADCATQLPPFIALYFFWVLLAIMNQITPFRQAAKQKKHSFVENSRRLYGEEQ